MCVSWNERAHGVCDEQEGVISGGERVFTHLVKHGV